MDAIIFNPQYVLKPDSGRTLILAAEVGRDSLKNMNENFETFIHPVYAMILSFIDGRGSQTCINTASQYLHVSPSKIEKFVNKLLDNPKYVKIETTTGASIFPPHTIIKSSGVIRNRRFKPEMFFYDYIDLRYKRHLTPTSVTLMVNNICETSCYYCYADKSKPIQCKIPLKRIFEIISEARLSNVRSFDVIGGEFFLYKDWKKLLEKLLDMGYNPYLSTKIPLDENIICTLQDLNIRDIQISLDSLIEEHLVSSLKVQQGYVNKIKETINLLGKHGIEIMIHTVLSQKNSTIEDMESIYSFIRSINKIREWKIDKAGQSMYAETDYADIEIGNDTLNTLCNYLMGLEKQSCFDIRFPRPQIPNQIPAKNTASDFFNRGFCSGNFSSMFILPDGNVTICEELYWNPHFIMGNVLRQSLNDIWNSAKANSLFHLRQEDIPQDSLCHSCNKYVECRSVKQVCYREIIKKYGKDKWYYPDVNCPYILKDS